MRVPHLIFVCLAGAAASCVGTVAWPQNYPAKPIRIVTSEPGGSADVATRTISQAIAAPLGQPIIVENHPGGIIVAETVAKANPDGYTLLYAGTSFMFGPFFQKTPYDPVKDFAPITIIAKSPAVLVVPSSLPVKSVTELIALAKAKPGALNYASATIGSGTHLSMELFKSAAGINVVRISYKGGGPALTGLLSGEAQMMIYAPGLVAPHLKAGTLRALGVTSSEPSPLAPGMPTLAATGLPGFVWVTMDGMWAPARTPAAVINRLNREIVRVLNTPEVRERFFIGGAETAGSSPDALTASMKTDLARVGKVISALGIRAQ